MKFSGELFTYDNESNLTAFEIGPTSTEKTVVFIGGLGDGFNAVPYLVPLVDLLVKSNWSLTQVLLSSSYNQYGFSNLQTDAEQLDLLVHYLKEKRSKNKIVFLGHSTGSQDCYWHNKYGQTSQDVAGYIMQAPVSDREYFKATLVKFEYLLDLAIQLRREGKGQDFLPNNNAFWAPVTADRFFSFASKGGDDDVFSTDLTEDELKVLYKNIERPICWIYSDQDEFYASKQDKVQVMKRFEDICPAIKLTAIVPNADHKITRQDSQKYFCSIVDNFLQSI